MTDAARHELEDAAIRVSDELNELTDRLERQRKRSRLWLAVGVVVLVPLVLVATLGVFFMRASACQAEINRRLRTVAAAERKDYNETWQKILDSKNPGESRAVFAAHLARRKAAEAERDAIVKKERNVDKC